MNLELDDTKLTQAIMLDNKGQYEKEISDLMQKLLGQGDCFIDCGAHVGYFTILGSELCSKVYAFEADKDNFASLMNNIEINNVSSNVIAHNQAVGDECKKVKLFVNLDNDGGHALWDVSKHPFNEQTRLKKKKPTRVVDMVTLDSVIDEPIKLIKFDVEGCEFLALKGAEKLICKYSPVLILEINNSALGEMGTSKEEIFSYLESLGYEGFKMTDDDDKNYAVNVAFVRVK
jgi:FkbM family methyltransferase